jgi:hypothetical protein
MASGEPAGGLTEQVSAANPPREVARMRARNKAFIGIFIVIDAREQGW